MYKRTTLTIYSSPFLAKVQDLVRNRPATLTITALAAEIGVSRAWLSSFATGKMSGVSAEIAEKLYVRLSGKQLVDNEPQRVPA